MRYHLYLGLGLLGALLALGLILNSNTTRMVQDVENHLLEAEKALSEENLHRAWQCANEAKTAWIRTKPQLSLLVEQEKLSAIDQELDLLASGTFSDDRSGCVRSLVVVRAMLRGITDGERLTWRNLLTGVCDFTQNSCINISKNHGGFSLALYR